MYRQTNRIMLAMLATVSLGVMSGHADAAPILDVPLPDLNESHSRATPVVINLDDYFSGVGGLIYKIVSNSNPLVVSPNLAGNTLSLSFNAGTTGASTLKIEANEGADNITDSFLVTAGNAAPVANPSAETFDIGIVEDMGDFQGDFSFIFSDADPGDVIAYSLGNVSGANVFAVTIDNASGVANFSSIANANGTQAFEFVGTDLAGDSDTYTVTLIADPVNDPPQTVGVIAAQGMAEDDPPRIVNFAGVFADVDVLFEGDAFTALSIANDNPGLVTVVPLGGGAGVSLLLAANRSGTANLTVGLRDSAGAVATVSFPLTVLAVNDPCITDGFQRLFLADHPLT